MEKIKIIKKIIKFLIYIGFSVMLLILVTFLLIHLKARPYIWNDIKSIPHTNTALILGAYTLTDGSLSPVLRQRVDTAIELYKKEKVDNILVSGDNSTLLYNEVNPVRIYLLEKGILDKNIFLDHAGFDTYSSMYRARDVFLADNITVVTQSFHLSRAIFIARALGVNAYGMSSDKSDYKTRNYVRELFANVKAVMDLVIYRQPKYLGDEIPLTGDGRDNK